jgi:hypothetical protein
LDWLKRNLFEKFTVAHPLTVTDAPKKAVNDSK